MEAAGDDNVAANPHLLHLSCLYCLYCHAEILFCLGMLEKYRSFRHIQRRYLPKRTVHELNG
jgi:hypothetical protein